jgi:hypothetical protein
MTSLLHIIILAQHPPPRPPPEGNRAAPPPLPPQSIDPLSHFDIARLRSSVEAPPPSPPYAQTPAGQREEGRGTELQRQLVRYLQDRLALLRHGSPSAVRKALTEIAVMALETTTPALRSTWLASIHPAAFRRACVAGSSRSANGEGSVVEALVAMLEAEPQGEVAEETCADSSFAYESKLSKL